MSLMFPKPKTVTLQIARGVLHRHSIELARRERRWVVTERYDLPLYRSAIGQPAVSATARTLDEAVSTGLLLAATALTFEIERTTMQRRPRFTERTKRPLVTEKQRHMLTALRERKREVLDWLFLYEPRAKRWLKAGVYDVLRQHREV